MHDYGFFFARDASDMGYQPGGEIMASVLSDFFARDASDMGYQPGGEIMASVLSVVTHAETVVLAHKYMINFDIYLY